jgi:hypothetical protein
VSREASSASRIVASACVSNLRANSFPESRIAGRSSTVRSFGPGSTDQSMYRRLSFVIDSACGELARIVWKNSSSGM